MTHLSSPLASGHSYFGYLLRDPRFAAQNGDWPLLGLNSASGSYNTQVL